MPTTFSSSYDKFLQAPKKIWHIVLQNWVLENAIFPLNKFDPNIWSFSSEPMFRIVSLNFTRATAE